MNPQARNSLTASRDRPSSLSRTLSVFFFFNDTATTEIYTLSLHDALPIFSRSLREPRLSARRAEAARAPLARWQRVEDRKSTRLNSSHMSISYAVFCL